MRTAYALLGVVWVIIIVALWWSVNRSFTPAPYSATVKSNASSSMLDQLSTLNISSRVFEYGGMMPPRYTCDDPTPHHPPLEFAGVPEAAKSLVLIMDDPDVPKALLPSGVFDHWVLYNIPPNTTGIAEDASAGMPGSNGAGQSGYAAPCPPAQYEPSEHRYFFKLYALDTELQLAQGATKAQVEDAMQGHILAQAELMGRYKRK